MRATCPAHLPGSLTTCDYEYKLLSPSFCTEASEVEHCQPKHLPWASTYLLTLSRTVYLMRILTLSFHAALGSRFMHDIVIYVAIFGQSGIWRALHYIHINRARFMTMYVCYLPSCVLCRSHDVLTSLCSKLCHL
jgi:hypothetical protein